MLADFPLLATPHSFEVVDIGKLKLQFAASSGQDREEWVDKLESIVQKYFEKFFTVKAAQTSTTDVHQAAADQQREMEASSSTAGSTLPCRFYDRTVSIEVFPDMTFADLLEEIARAFGIENVAAVRVWYKNRAMENIPINTDNDVQAFLPFISRLYARLE